MTDAHVSIAHRDERHGFDLKLHSDATGTVRHDLFRASVAQYRALSDATPTSWVQIGPVPLEVNADLAGNGQLPGPNSGAVLDIAIDRSGPTDQNIYLVSNDGGVWKSTDGGTRWSALTDSLDTLSFGAIALDRYAPETIYAGTGSIPNNGYYKGIGVYRSTKGGTDWALLKGSEQLNGVGIAKMVSLGGGILLVATERGLWRYADTDPDPTLTVLPIGGQPMDRYISDLVLDLDSDRGTAVVYACVSGLGIYKCTDGTGLTFNDNLWDVNSGGPAQGTYTTVRLGVSRTFAPFAHSMYASVESDSAIPLKVFKSVNDGAAWTDITDNALKESNWTRDGKTVDEGRRMGQYAMLNYDQIVAVDPQDPNRVYMGFQDLWLSTDGGDNWTDVRLDATYTTELMHVDFHALTFSPPEHWPEVSGAPTALWVGNDGGIWSSTDGGTAWTNHNNATRSTNLVRCIDTGRGVIANQFTYAGMQDTGTAMTRPRDEGTWTAWLGGDGEALAVDPSNAQYAYALWGPPYYTQDGGSTHALANVADGLDGYSDIAVGPDRTVYLAGSTFLYCSFDFGENFTKLSWTATYEISSIETCPSDPTILWLSLKDASIVRLTIPAGLRPPGPPTTKSFTINGASAGQVASLAVDPSNADRVVAVFGGYSGHDGSPSFPFPSCHVFLTTNAGQDWGDIGGSQQGANVPDMPLYSAAIDPHSQAIIVSSDMGIMATRDVGNTWQTMGAGMPNVHAVSLAIDTTVTPSKLKVGTYGRGTWQIALQW
jgi:photosystem II stability/assembly factor-like uncharacterized protein